MKKHLTQFLSALLLSLAVLGTTVINNSLESVPEIETHVDFEDNIVEG